jgi:hypothetical protein
MDCSVVVVAKLDMTNLLLRDADLPYPMFYPIPQNPNPRSEK